MNFKYPIQVNSAPQQGIPSISAEFGRITVLLGSNGTGKSRALKQIRGMTNSFGETNRPAIYIEGGRVITLPNALTYDYNTYNQFGGPYVNATSNYRSRRMLPLLERNKDIFYLLERRADAQKVKHSEAVTLWQLNSCLGVCPTAEPDPLKSLFTMFSEVFPEITLTIENTNKELLAYKNGQRYGVSELSDGERQVLFILADIAHSAEPNSLIIADEPELNLNSQLANRLWDTIEGKLPHAIFVYATHNVGFALRQSVECVIALSGHGVPAMPMKSINDLEEKDARDLLGAIPAILAAPAAVGVEGTTTSFDNGFYTWLLKRTDIAIVPLGSCQDVIAATTRRGFWQELAPTVKLIGIIDQDYRAETPWVEAEAFCHMLEYHEAESYLCYPPLIEKLAAEIGTVEVLPSQSTIAERILLFFGDQILQIAMKRMIYRAQIKLNVALNNAQFKKVKDISYLRQLIGHAADQEAAKANDMIGSSSAIRIFDEELEHCQNVLEKRNLDEILRLCPGKELLWQLVQLAGCKDSAALARAVYKHLDPLDFAPLVKLREHIYSKITPLEA